MYFQWQETYHKKHPYVNLQACEHSLGWCLVSPFADVSCHDVEDACSDEGKLDHEGVKVRRGLGDDFVQVLVPKRSANFLPLFVGFSLTIYKTETCSVQFVLIKQNVLYQSPVGRCDGLVVGRFGVQLFFSNS